MRERRLHGSHRAPPEAARAAARHLAATEAFARARRIAAYAALPDELSTEPLFELVEGARKILLLPRMDATGGRLVFAQQPPGAELRVGRYGLREPIADTTSPLDEGDLVVVPGVAFDRWGHRLGRGGGWYDRTFAPSLTSSGPRLFGFAYFEQVIERVPHGPRDRRVEAIVTDRGVIFAEGVERSG